MEVKYIKQLYLYVEDWFGCAWKVLWVQTSVCRVCVCFRILFAKHIKHITVFQSPINWFVQKGVWAWKNRFRFNGFDRLKWKPLYVYDNWLMMDVWERFDCFECVCVCVCACEKLMWAFNQKKTSIKYYKLKGLHVIKAEHEFSRAYRQISKPEILMCFEDVYEKKDTFFNFLIWPVF